MTDFSQRVASLARLVFVAAMLGWCTHAAAQTPPPVPPPPIVMAEPPVVVESPMVDAPGVVTMTGPGSGDASDAAATLPAGVRIPLDVSPFGMALSPDGARLYVTDNNRNSITEVDLTARRALRTIGEPLAEPDDGCPHNLCRGIGAFGVAVSADGARLFVTSLRADALTAIDLASGTPVWSAKVQRFPRDVLLSPDGRLAWVFNSVANSISAVDTGTGTLSGATIALEGGDASHMAFGRDVSFALSPDGTRVFVGSAYTDSIDVFDTATRGRSARIDGGSPQHLSVDAASGSLVARFDDGLAEYDLATLAPRAVLRYCRPMQASGPALSPDGKSLALTLYDARVALVVDRATGLLTHAFATGKWPLELRFSPDSATLLVLNSGTDASVSVLDVRTPMDTAEYVARSGEPFCRATP